jgi:predicted nucleic acid-binding protein
MRVLVDTPIWSLALRRRPPNLNPTEVRQVAEWSELVREGRIALLGIVRQEMLSGIADEQQFLRLTRVLRAFPDESVGIEDYEEAARCFNRCRAGGIQGSPVDFLICAVAIRADLAIFTADPDFTAYARHLPLTLHEVRASLP